MSVCGPRASREDDWRRASELGGEPDAHLARVRFGLGLGLGAGVRAGVRVRVRASVRVRVRGRMSHLARVVEHTAHRGGGRLAADQ